jgi:hypothetical protein
VGGEVEEAAAVQDVVDGDNPVSKGNICGKYTHIDCSEMSRRGFSVLGMSTLPCGVVNLPGSHVVRVGTHHA